MNSRGRAEEGSGTAAPVPTSSPGQNLGSPELCPLPPLARLVRRVNGDGGFSSEEEFYSPSDSPVQKRVPDIKLNVSAAPLPEKRGSTVSTLSTPSYPSSNAASSPSPSSPTVSSPPAIDSSPGRANNKLPKIVVFKPLLRSSPPPAPPMQLRPMTPSPPKRKPPSPSPPHSPPKKVSDSRPIQNLWSPRIFGDFVKDPFIVVTPKPPPPPPSRYYLNHFVKFPAQQANSLVFATDTPESSVSMERNEGTARPKLKPLHWDKVKASSDRAMAWDQMKSSSFQLNEEMIETLFVYDTKNTVYEGGRRSTPSAALPENRVLDPKRSQNVAILLRALNVTTEEVCEALLEGNTDALGNELLETLLRMAPSKEEELKLREYKDNSPFKLGPAEMFLKAVVQIPFAFKKVEAMLYIANFDIEVNYLTKSFETLEAACEELKSSRLFLKLLEAVLKTGNRMNVGTNRGDAQAFKLDTLLKLVDVKGTDGKTTLLHFVVQEIIRAEGYRANTAAQPQSSAIHDDLECRKFGLQIVSALGNELVNVKNSAGMDSDVLTSYVLKLTGGIGKVREAVRLNESARDRKSVV